MEANDTKEDPFKVRLKFSVLDYIKMAILGVTLLPVRITGMVLCIVMAWLLSVIGMIGWSEDRPVTGWRKLLQNLVGFLGRASMFFIGFHWVTYHGRQCTTVEAPVLVVAPHTSFFDALVVFCAGFPYFINRTENKSIPLLGKCITFRQAVFVSRDLPDSRQKTVEEITRRVRDCSGWSQLIIFPEGATSNGGALLTFKAGGFIPGVSVQPVMIKYPNLHDTTSWTWDQSHGALGCILYTMTQFYTKAEIHFLPCYSPSQEEQADPQLFADNVRSYMASQAGLPLCHMTYSQIKEKYSHKNKQQ